VKLSDSQDGQMTPSAKAIKRSMDKARQNGMCAKCRCRPSRNGRSSCERCVEYRRTLLARWRADGRCVCCGGERQEGTVLCAHCAELAKAKNKRLRASKIEIGICSRYGCWLDASGTYTMCDVHLAENRERVRRYRLCGTSQGMGVPKTGKE
jgi:hypothetical protein